MPKRLFNEVNSFFYKLMDKNCLSERQSTIILAGIITMIFLLRVYTLNIPLPDRTSWKEIDYITISQNYVSNGFNFIQPTISWPAEEPRVTAMELPLVPYLAGIVYHIFGFNIFSVRIIPLIVYILIIWVIFKLVKRETGPVPALFAATMAGFIPLTSEFGNILFSYPAAILTGMTSIFLFSKWIDNGKNMTGFFSCGFFSLTLLLMPTELTIIIPIFWLFERKSTKIISWKKILLFILASFILPIIWYTYVYFLAKKSIDVFGVFGGHNKYQIIEMLTKKSWYYIIFKRILALLSGPMGFFSCFIGFLVILFFRKGSLFLFYGISFAAFVLIVAEGNIDAPYRQFCGIPAMAAFFGIGFTYFISLILWGVSNLTTRTIKSVSVVLAALVLIVPIILMTNYKFLFNRDKDQPMMRNEWILGKEIENHSIPGSTIVTAGAYSIHKGGNDLSPVLYYYSKRQGWSLQNNQFSIDSLEAYKRKGAAFFAAENISREKELKSFCEELKNKYQIIYQDNSLELLLLDLNSQK
jgi:4-amino-4-deoxy-L-arabinose transferase-like glycosyltransferase